VKFDPPFATGELRRRYKRFLADIETTDGQRLTVHCPNTGAMRGCDAPGSEVWYSASANPKRKYPHTLEVVVTERGQIGINTGRANGLVREAFEAGKLGEFSGFAFDRAEIQIPDEAGRFDLLLRDSKTARLCYVEVKNMTLCDLSGRGSFPDAVSERALKHVRALERRVVAGDRAALVFCVQHSGVLRATLADEIHPTYGTAVRAAAARGVEVYAYRCHIGRREISVDCAIPVDLADQRELASNPASVS
jgi:sugar fermentation stimulation protein A